MTLEEIRFFCNQLPAVTEDIKWENHLCFSVGEKMFLITAPDLSPVTASFKVGDDDFELLSAKPGLQPAPYLARYKWIHTDDINNLSEKEWHRYLSKAYELIKMKLPKKKLKDLRLI